LYASVFEKLKHANSILEYLEYFCQMPSKSIVMISSYTSVSKLVRFFWDTVYTRYICSYLRYESRHFFSHEDFDWKLLPVPTQTRL